MAQMVVSISPASALLSYGADLNADLLVVGGYGHSRLREIMLGGVTRELLRHMAHAHADVALVGAAVLSAPTLAVHAV